jgi:hypothetical protein
VAPGFGIAQFRAKVQSMTGQAEAGYTQRHAGYGLKKLRGKQLMGRSRRYEVSASSMRAVSALYVLRDQVIRPVRAGLRTTEHNPQPTLAPALYQDYERLRLHLQLLYQELGIAA